MIKLQNVTKKFGEQVVFDDFSLELEGCKITAILGASGVGKTTLLNVLAGLTPYEGAVSGAERVSFLFQEDRLLPFKTVQKNLEYVLGKGDYREALKSVGLEGAENKYPSQLSGGMARRVALLRAFLFDSDVLLMDEPFGSLDLGIKYKLMELFKTMWEKDKRTTVLVTHNLDEALKLGDRIIVLGKGGTVLFDEKKDDGEQMRKKIEDIFLKD